MLPKTGLAASLATSAVVAGLIASASASMPPATDIPTADNTFGFRLLNAAQADHPRQNVVLSPVSAALDLAMALDGASGETAAEIHRVLALETLDSTQINNGNAALIKTLRTPVKGVTLSVADSLWTDRRRITLNPEYMARTQRWYDAEIREVDFGSADTPREINGWADRQTHGRIPHLIDSIAPDEVALLLNAIYFKGQWTHKFDKAQTHNADFTLVDGSKKTLPRMSQSGRFDYFATPDMQAIRLPYADGQLAMDVFLPSKSSSLAQFESDLTPGTWKAWQAKFSSQKGQIELPRFELKNRYALNAPLQRLGMKRAFDVKRAQFDTMTHSKVAISSVRQWTYLKVDEEGSEAAAVTSIGIHVTAVVLEPPPFSMIVDRPFFCTIEDRRTGALLFLGAIYDPT